MIAKKGNGNGDDDAADDVPMDTSDTRTGPSEAITTHVQLGGSGTGGSGRMWTTTYAVTPFNSNLQTPLAKVVVAKLHEISPGLERQSPSTPRAIVFAEELYKALSLVTPQSRPGSSSISGSSSLDKLARGGCTQLSA
jgi:hypothetical protein